jgi:5-methyltetrahydrofolate--homocysteine methyltransferase
MTTTVPEMEKTVQLIKKEAPWCKTIVGGAVLTQEYADKMRADKYAGDAMECVRYLESIVK